MDDLNHEYIKRYRKGELTETEIKEFEEKCASDDNFSKSVAQFIQLEGIAIEEEKSRLKELYKEDKKSGRNKFLLLIVGLILIGLFVFRSFYFSNNSLENTTPVKEEMIFAMLVEEHQDANRGNDDTSKNNLYKKWFEEERYDTLLFELEGVDVLDVNHVNEFIWVIQSFYYQNQNNEIINLIDAYMTNNPDNISRKDELLWLQTLAYLKADDKEKAKSNLEEIINEYRLYQTEAKQLLDSLK